MLTLADLRYLGAFRVPFGFYGVSSFEYADFGLAYLPDGTLIMTGAAKDQASAIISIPAPVVANRVQDLPRAIFKIPFADILKGLRSKIAPVKSDTKIGGYLVTKAGLVVSVYRWYDDSAVQQLSHFMVTADGVTGPYQLAVPERTCGFVSGYMAHVPQQWQPELGEYLTGNSCLSIIARTSCGPAISMFDPLQLGKSGLLPTTPLLGYPFPDHQLGGPDGLHSTGEFFNGTTQIHGCAIVRDTILFFGRHGLGKLTYGFGGGTAPKPDPGATPWIYANNDPHHAVCRNKDGHIVNWDYDPADSSHSMHAYPYRSQVWAYSVQGLLDVRRGLKQRWEPQPQVWPLSVPFAHPRGIILGAAYDQAGGRIFVSCATQDGGYPLVHCYQVGG